MSVVRRAKPIAVVEARRLYEQTNLPVDHIAAMHGIGRTALYRRIHQWGWRMRKPGVPLVDPPREADEIPAADGASEVASEIAVIAARIRRAVERELDAIEQTAGPPGADGAPERPRMLASLARTLQEVARLDLRPGEQTPSRDDDDRRPADRDEFVRELVRRMDEFAGRTQSAVPVDASPAVAGVACEGLD